MPLARRQRTRARRSYRAKSRAGGNRSRFRRIRSRRVRSRRGGASSQPSTPTKEASHPQQAAMEKLLRMAQSESETPGSGKPYLESVIAQADQPWEYKQAAKLLIDKFPEGTLDTHQGDNARDISAVLEATPEEYWKEPDPQQQRSSSATFKQSAKKSAAQSSTMVTFQNSANLRLFLAEPRISDRIKQLAQDPTSAMARNINQDLATSRSLAIELSKL